MERDIWGLVDDLVDTRHEYEESIYKDEIKDIKEGIETLAQQIEIDLDEAEYEHRQATSE